MTALEEQEIKGVTLNLIKTVIVSTVVITSSIVGTYFGLSAKIETISAENQRKWDVHQVEYNTGKVLLENGLQKLADHDTRIIKLEAKN